MEKIFIVSEKNLEKNIYETKTIVILNDNQAPTIVEYKGVEDLLSVVSIAEKNGFDILGQNGIKPAIEAGLIQVVSLSNKKAMAELKANILQEELKYLDMEKNVINEVEESIENEVENVEIPEEKLEEESLIENEEPVAIEEEKANEENKITAETTMFKPVNGIVDFPIEEREYAEYLRLNVQRAKNQIDEDGLKKIKQMTRYNEKVAAMEKARQDVIDANELVVRYAASANQNKELVDDLNDKQKTYEELATNYRNELYEAIKEFTNSDNKVEKIETENEEVVSNEKAEPVVEERIIPIRENEEKKETVEPEVKEIIVPTKKEETVEPEVKEIIVPAKKEETVEPEVKEIIVPVKKEEVVESRIENNNEEIVKENKTKKEYVDDPNFIGKHAPKEARENANKQEVENNIILTCEGIEGKAEGIHPETDEQHEIKIVDESGKEETVKVKTTSKLKKFFKAAGALLLAIGTGIAGYLIGKDLTKKNNKTTNKNTEVTRILTNNYGANPIFGEKPVTIDPVSQLGEETNESKEANTTANTNVETPVVVAEAEKASINVSQIVADYCEEYNVPEATRLFLQQDEVVKFLNKYKNEGQLKEVISALCYGYEANILTTKDANFRLEEDADVYLTSFTRDFLCAKVVVNRYNARQIVNVFGNEIPSYEELMNGFQSYTHTVRTYYLNAKEPLPFHYLTNNDEVATRELNNLSEKALIVNQNRDAHTLTSKHTDDFISAVFDLYVVNDEKLNMSEGAKAVGGAIVQSYAIMQVNVDNEEALFLHEDRGMARAGINLRDVDGHFGFEYPDKTHYEFTSLFDVMNHGYGDVNETAARCVSQQEELLNNLNVARELDKSNIEDAKEDLINALYEEGYDEYASRIKEGNVSDRLLNEILSLNPMLTEEANAVKYARENPNGDYIGFKETCDGVDELLGIKNRKENDYATLINNRRNTVLLYKDYSIVDGKRYTSSFSGGYGGSYSDASELVQEKVVETETYEEQVAYEDLTPEEKVEADQQVEELQRQEEIEHQQQLEEIEETKEELREGVAEGKTQEELEVIAEEHGIELDPNYQENMAAALEEQKQGEEKKAEIEQAVVDHNKEAEEEAARRAEEERLQQEEQRRQEEELIRLSMEAEQNEETYAEEVSQDAQEEVINVVDSQENLPPVEEGISYYEEHTELLDQTDENRVDVEAGEEVYIPSAKVVDELKELRQMALNMNVDVEGLSLGKRFNGRTS